MCGVVGFFTGCPLEQTCELRKSGSCKSNISIDKIFQNWNEKSSVRSAPRRILQPEEAHLDLFPRHLAPISQHSIIASKYADKISELLCLQLYRYLYFTINLELIIVNPNILRVSLASKEFMLSEQESLATVKMYVDEGYHALFCMDLAKQLNRITNLSPNHNTDPHFLKEYRRITSESSDSALAGIMFTSVSETLITGSLSEVAIDGSTPSSVKELMKDHARDEARHHAFFKELIWRIGKNNPLGLQKMLHLIPESIYAFIQPDMEQLRASLLQVGVTRDDTEQILHETYPTDEITKYARNSAKDLLGFLDSEGISRNARLNEKLEEYQLIGKF